MFNIIVSTGLQDLRHGSILASRVFEEIDESVREQFQTNGLLNNEALMKLPTLFMEEGVEDEAAGIGWITQIRRDGSYYKFNFTLDPHLPKITNSDIYKIHEALGMKSFQFHRNHWSIKEGNIYRELYLGSLDKNSEPSVFKLSSRPVTPKKVSFMMPFSLGFNDVYSELKEALESEGYTCQRADDMWKNNHILDDIIELLCTSEVIVFDLTGKNPNVFYEAGIAHTLGKKFILITQSPQDVPFDLQSIRYIPYLPNKEGRKDLAAKVLARVEALT